MDSPNMISLPEVTVRDAKNRLRPSYCADDLRLIRLNGSGILDIEKSKMAE